MTNSTRIERITAILTEQLQPTTLEIRDDSGGHQGHAGAPPGSSETHLHITIQADALAGKTRVQQHQAVMGLIKEEFDSGLHALQIEVA